MLLLAATSPKVNLLAVNVNYPSTYSALAASAILTHYGKADVPIGIPRPLTNTTFFDGWYYKLGEYTSKIAFQWSGGSLPWGNADDAWDPVKLYRKALADAEDGSVTIASIGFFDNVSCFGPNSTDSGLLTPLKKKKAIRPAELDGRFIFESQRPRAYRIQSLRTRRHGRRLPIGTQLELLGLEL